MRLRIRIDGFSWFGTEHLIHLVLVRDGSHSFLVNSELELLESLLKSSWANDICHEILLEDFPASFISKVPLSCLFKLLDQFRSSGLNYFLQVSLWHLQPMNEAFCSHVSYSDCFQSFEIASCLIEYWINFLVSLIQLGNLWGCLFDDLLSHNLVFSISDDDLSIL